MKANVGAKERPSNKGRYKRPQLIQAEKNPTVASSFTLRCLEKAITHFIEYSDVKYTAREITMFIIIANMAESSEKVLKRGLSPQKKGDHPILLLVAR
jgi:hypothetical protein